MSNKYPKTLNNDLFDAAQAGNAQACRDLLSQGAKVNTRRSNYSPLHNAAGSGNVDTCRVLLDAGANIDSPGLHRYTPLHWASGANHAGVVRFLLERGADIHAKNIDGDTPLHHALQFKSGATFVTLLDAGADLDLPNSRQITPRISAKDHLPVELKSWLARQSALEAINEITGAIEKTSTAAKTPSKPMA